MLFWSISAVLIALAVGSILVPLSSRARPMIDGAEDREALRELDARAIDASPDDRAEIERERAALARQLIRSDAKAAAAHGKPWPSRIAAVLALLVVPAVALGLYASFGVPGTATAAIELPSAEAPRDEVVAVLERHLMRSPNDVEGWRTLANAEASRPESGRQVVALSQLVRLEGRRPPLLSELGEALVRAQGDRIPDDAKALFAEAYAADPDDRRAGYYHALSLEQGGEREAARAVWEQLVTLSPDDAAWQEAVSSRLEGRVGAPIAQSGPDAAQVAAAEAMAPEDRRAFIRSMVEGLRDRLIASPDDVAGWERLFAAYGVLGEPEGAVAAAKTALASDVSDDTRAALVQLTNGVRP